MRIAIALSLLLIALLGGGVALLPRLIVWDDHRAELTAQVEALTGQLVAIQGRIDLELLPRPTLTLARATLASRAAAPAEHALTVDRLDLRLEPLPLLAGRLEVDEIRLVRPVLQVAPPARPGGTLLALTGGGAMLPRALDGPSRLSVVDGRALLSGAGGAPAREIEAINLELVAEGANGPFSLEGGFVMAAQPFDLRVQLGQTAPESWSTLQLEVTAQAAQSPTRLSFRGRTWTEAAAPRLSGDLVLSGQDARAALLVLDPGLRARLPQLPDWLGTGFRLAGRLEFADDTAELDELQITLGEREAEGELRLALGAPPALDLRLGLPRLSAPDVVMPDGDSLAMAAALAAATAGQIDLSIGELAWRGGTIRRVRATLALDGAGGLTVEQARATLPGQSTLGFNGTLVGSGREAALEGELTLVSSDLRDALGWLDLQPAAVPEGRLRTLSLASGLSLSDGALRFTDGELRVDASRLAGSLALSLGARTQIAGALTLDRLNLDAYWPGGEVRELVDRTLAAFRSFDAAIEARVERLTWHGVRLQDLVLDGRSVAGRLSVNQLSLHDLAGNQGRLTGEFDLAGETFDLAAELETTRPAQLLRRLGLEPPLMLARLTPLRLAGTLHGDLERGELDVELRHHEARLALAGPVEWSGAQPSYELAVDAAHPDYPVLLDALGIAPLPEDAVTAPFGLTGRLEGDLRAAAVVGSARLGTMSLTGEVGWQGGAARPRVSLRLSAGEPSAAALQDLLALTGLRVDPARLQRPRPGAWSTELLDLRWLGAFDAELELSGKGGLAGPGFELQARLDQGRLLIDHLSAALWGGRVAVQCSLDARRPLPFMALAVDLSAIDASALAGWLDLPPVVDGRADLYAETTATGDNPRALIGSLIGELRVTLRDGRLVGGERLAALRPRAAVQGARRDGAAAVDGQDADGRERAALALDGLSGSFTLKRGIATATAVPLKLAQTPARLAGSIDLLVWAADLRLELDPAGSGTAGLQVVGPLDRPQVRLLPRPPAERPLDP